MVLPCKQKAIYVKCCVIANGITDKQGDTLYTEDIKKIFTSFNNQNNFEIYHNTIPIEGVSLLENYISTADESIGTAVVPAGSWNAVIRVDNPEIQDGLLRGEFKGVSLNNRIRPQCKGNLKGTIRYQDIADTECVIPIYISFVEGGANGYGLHVMDYDAYIQKSKDVKITNNNNIGDTIMDLKEFLEGLKSLIQKAEETPANDDSAKDEDPKEEDEAVEVKKEEKPKEEDEAVVKKATTNEEEDEEDKPAIEKEAEPTTEPSAKEEEAKDDIITKLEERISKLEKIIEELAKEEEDTKEDEEQVKEETDTPKITKSKNVILENQTNTVNTNYYEMTGRDPITGVKIRNQSKIM